MKRLALILTFLASAAWAQTGALAAGTQNGVYLPGSCASNSPPSWCSGSDIGAWTNAAIAAGGCGEVYLPAGTFKQSTSIVQPRCVRLHAASGYGTTLSYIPTSGCSIVIADGSGTSIYPPGGVEDVNLIGPGSGTHTCGIYFGGSDGSATAPSTGIDAAANYGDHAVANRVRITQFGVGVQYGFNTWVNTLLEDVITSNGTGVYFPSAVATGTSGENMNIVASAIQNNSGVGLKIGTGLQVNFNVVGTSFNFNGSWGIQNGTATSQNSVNLTGCYITAESYWLQNYGYLNANGCYVSGGQTGRGGYLIDNQNRNNFTVSGGQWFNSNKNSVPMMNPSSAGSIWLGVLATQVSGNPLAPAVGVFDRFGNVGGLGAYFQSLRHSDPSFGSFQQDQPAACETSYGITTLNTGGTTTNTGQNCLPANAVIDAVVYRITTTITKAANFTIGDGSAANRFCTTQSKLTPGTTGVCLNHSGTSAQVQGSAAAVRVTTNAHPGAGAMRLIVYYHSWTAPTS